MSFNSEVTLVIAKGQVYEQQRIIKMLEERAVIKQRRLAELMAEIEEDQIRLDTAKQELEEKTFQVTSFLRKQYA